MMPLLQRHRAWLAPLVTLLVLTTLITAIIVPLQIKQEQYTQSIRKTEPRIERTQGLIQSAGTLEEQLGQMQQRAQKTLYPANLDENRLNTELQTRLRAIAQQSGLTVGSLSTPPARKEHNLAIILINLNLQGDLAALSRLLQNVQQPTDGAPALYVDSVSLRRANFAPNTPQTLNIDITLAALRPASSRTSTP